MSQQIWKQALSKIDYLLILLKYCILLSKKINRRNKIRTTTRNKIGTTTRNKIRTATRNKIRITARNKTMTRNKKTMTRNKEE